MANGFSWNYTQPDASGWHEHGSRNALSTDAVQHLALISVSLSTLIRREIKPARQQRQEGTLSAFARMVSIRRCASLRDPNAVRALRVYTENKREHAYNGPPAKQEVCTFAPDGTRPFESAPSSQNSSRSRCELPTRIIRVL